MTYQLFSEPKKTFEDVFNELKNAQSSIYLEAYDLVNDSISRELFRILARKSLDIKVVVIVDDFGFERPSKTTKKLIEASNIQMYRFNPLWQALKEKYISKISKFVMRTHRKLTIIDEKIAYVGGTNYTAAELSWRDIFVKIRGPLVSDLTKAFFEMKELCLNRNILHQPINKGLTREFKDTDILLRQVPHSRHRPYRKEFKRLFDAAKKEIRITTPYFIPTRYFQRMITRAIKRGVAVTILIPKKSDLYWVDILSDHFAAKLLNKKAKVCLQDQMSHAKYIVFDNTVCTFGSSNFDYVSFHNNHELNIISKDKKLVSELINLFDSDRKKSTAFSLISKRNKSLFKHAVARILYRFRKFF